MKLIIFFNGWGVPKEVFTPLNNGYFHIKIINLEDKLDFEELNNFSEIYIIAWSFGVYHASKTFENLVDERIIKKIKQKIAINGTSSAIHRRYGIAPIVFKKTLDSLDRDNFFDFMTNVGLKINIRENWKYHKQTLENFSQNYSEVSSFFEHCFISSKDRIFTPRSLLNFYKNKTYKIIDEEHFPFYRWKNWEELLNEF